MSILIRGMEMPVTCCYCPLMGYDPDIEWIDGGRETQGAYICVITHELIDNTKREEHCPLVEIPPHGDLIDRDVLMKLEVVPSDNWVFRAIEKAPTVIGADKEGEMKSEICKKCADKSCFGYDHRITECEDFQPQTNYDRLISKSPEELAEFIWGVETAGRAYGPRGGNAWINWLKEEAKE